MVKVRLSKDSPSVLAFDGDVLECFLVDGSKRFHISLIKGIQLEPRDKGKYLLTIQLKFDPVLLLVDEEAVPRVTEVIAGIQKEMVNYKFE